jgi:hypothetical protein
MEQINNRGKETVSAYVDCNIADAVRAAATNDKLKPAAWMAEAIIQRLNHEGLLPEHMEEQNTISDEVKATLEVAGKERLLKALGRLRRKASQERALA